jgi:hypothetical protein
MISTQQCLESLVLVLIKMIFEMESCLILRTKIGIGLIFLKN